MFISRVAALSICVANIVTVGFSVGVDVLGLVRVRASNILAVLGGVVRGVSSGPVLGSFVILMLVGLVEAIDSSSVLLVDLLLGSSLGSYCVSIRNSLVMDSLVSHLYGFSCVVNVVNCVSVVGGDMLEVVDGFVGLGVVNILVISVSLLTDYLTVRRSVVFVRTCRNTVGCGHSLTNVRLICLVSVVSLLELAASDALVVHLILVGNQVS